MKVSASLRKRFGVDPETDECYLSGKVSAGVIVSTEHLTGCPICGPNKGCNRRSKHQIRSWKNFRKTQCK